MGDREGARFRFPTHHLRHTPRTPEFFHDCETLVFGLQDAFKVEGGTRGRLLWSARSDATAYRIVFVLEVQVCCTCITPMKRSCTT